MEADDIPTSVTSLVYTAPALNTSSRVLSQNETAEFLAHFWPAIEAHIREQVAQEIETASLARLEAIDEDERCPSHWERHDEWCDAATLARTPSA